MKGVACLAKRKLNTFSRLLNVGDVVKDTTIQHEFTKGPWGYWGGAEYCGKNVFANGFIFKAEESQGKGDDTGGNGVCLKCAGRDVCSTIGDWGDWSEPQICPEGSFITGWRQNVERDQGHGDDSALDNVEYRCRDILTWEQTEDMKWPAIEWGTWSRWKECPTGYFICGIETRVEDPDTDDTALNDIKHHCCLPLENKKKKKKKKTGKLGRLRCK